MKYTEDLVPRVFFDALSPKLKLLFEDVLQEGMILTMVGGATRDFLLHGRVSKDIDLEVRMEIHLEEEEWKKTLFVLGQKLKASYEVEFLPFGILRIKVGDYVVEFSSPRVEQYSDLGPWGHSDFSAKLSPTFCHEDSFKRRDFTINAIGFEFADLMDLRIQDPFKGIEDLKAGILRPCCDDFFKDPVRLLRLIRFGRRFKYRLAPSLEMNLGKFDLTKLKPFHFCNEAFKAGFTTFLGDFFTLIEKEKISVAPDLLLFKEIQSHDFKCDTCKDFMELFVTKIFQGEAFELNTPIKVLAEKLGMKSNLLEQLNDFKKLLLSFHHYPLGKMLQELKLFLNQSDWKMAVTDERLQKMERFYFYERRLSTMQSVFELCFSSDFKVCLNTLGKIFPMELEGEEEFIQLVSTGEVAKENLAALRIYTHLKQAIISL